jgi:hypothetical protein
MVCHLPFYYYLPKLLFARILFPSPSYSVLSHHLSRGCGSKPFYLSLLVIVFNEYGFIIE